MGIVKSTGFRHCQVNWLPRDQATLSSIQVWFYYRYLGAVSPPGDCSLSARSHQETERSLSDKVWRIGGFGSCPKVQHCLKTKRLVEASYSLDQRDAENAGSLLDRFQRRAQQSWRTGFSEVTPLLWTVYGFRIKPHLSASIHS